MTVSPKEAEVGVTQRYCVRVPSEKSSPTVGLEVEFSVNLEITAIEAPSGWQGTAHKDRQGRIVAASWNGGSIIPGHSLEFGVLARNPEKPATLVWKAIQMYQDGSEVHWIGPPQAQYPAATIRVLKRPSLQVPETACSQEPTPSPKPH